MKEDNLSQENKAFLNELKDSTSFNHIGENNPIIKQIKSLPMLGKCDSLNVGVAATVLIYNATMKVKLECKYD